MPFLLINEDITRLDVDVIVNAANTSLLAGGGVCGAIFAAAGYQKLEEACEKLSPISTGEAVITPGFNLQAKYIIHTAGPIYQEHSLQNRPLLQACYQNSLSLAYKKGLRSIAFPLISSGIYGYPQKEAYEIAKDTITTFLKDHDMRVYLTLLDKIDIPHDEFDRYLKLQQISKVHPMRHFPMTKKTQKSNITGKPFLEQIKHYIEELKLTESQFCYLANMDHSSFHKMISSDQPTKDQILSSCIALSLPLEEIESFLYINHDSLAKDNLRDCIIRYVISQQQYDIFNINDMLFYYDQKLLGEE